MPDSFRSTRSLIIEDDVDLANLVKLHLEQMGHEVACRTEPEEIFDAVTRQNFDLIVTDWMMPKIDGITLIKVIRSKNGSLNHSPRILMMSSIEDEKAQTYALKNGADRYLTKTAPSGDSRCFKERLTEAVMDLLS